MIHVDAIKVLTSPSYQDVADLCDQVYNAGVDLNRVVGLLKDECAQHAKPKWKRGHAIWNVPECAEGYECYCKITGECFDTEVVFNLGILKVDVTKWSIPVQKYFTVASFHFVLSSLVETALVHDLVEEMRKWAKVKAPVSIVFVRNSKQITHIDFNVEPTAFEIELKAARNKLLGNINFETLK